MNGVIGRKKSQRLVSVGGKLSLDQTNNFFHTMAISLLTTSQLVNLFQTVISIQWVKFKLCTFSVSSVLTQLQTPDIWGHWTRWQFSIFSEVYYWRVDWITDIFNMSIWSGSIPRAWKQSNVSPFTRGEVVVIQGILYKFLLFR